MLPSLQDLAMLLGEPRRSVLEADCRFCSDGEVIEKEKAKLASLRMASAESLGAWLLDFFRYYGKEQLEAHWEGPPLLTHGIMACPGAF